MGVEQVNKRIANQYAVLRELHFNAPLRRGELSSRHNIRKSSVTSIVQELVESGLLTEDPPQHTRSQLSLDHSRYHAQVASLTPESVRFARVYLDGRIDGLSEIPIDRKDTSEVVLNKMAHEFQTLLSKTQAPLLGVGLSMPGFIDPENGICLQTVHFKHWEKDIQVGETLSRKLGRTVLVDNDVRCQLWSCAWFDRMAAKNQNQLYLQIDNGVSCAIMANGQRVMGAQFAAGEIGRVRVTPNGSAKDEDRLENYCSLPAIMKKIMTAYPAITLNHVSDIVPAMEKEPGIAELLNQTMEILASPLAGMVSSVDPHDIIIGTRDPALTRILAPIIEAHLYNKLEKLRHANFRIADAVDTLSLRGIAGLVIDHAFSNTLLAASDNG
jgi:predicted NBD/HSP70 family sugar kinase